MVQLEDIVLLHGFKFIYSGLNSFHVSKKKEKEKHVAKVMLFYFFLATHTHLKVGTPFLIHHPVTRLGRERGKGGGGREKGKTK